MPWADFSPERLRCENSTDVHCWESDTLETLLGGMSRLKAVILGGLNFEFFYNALAGQEPTPYICLFTPLFTAKYGSILSVIS